jgi:ABC-type sugar transport system ATPase subunit
MSRAPSNVQGPHTAIGPGAGREMVFQGYSLDPWKTVAVNIAFGLEAARMRVPPGASGSASCRRSWASSTRSAPEPLGPAACQGAAVPSANPSNVNPSDVQREPSAPRTEGGSS